MNKLSLNYCLVTQNLASIIEDSMYDSDRYPDVSDISGEVTFTPNIANGKAYQLVDSDGKTYTVPVSRVQAKIVDGVISHEYNTGVYLFAAGAGSNPDKITYSVEYRNLRSGDLSFSLSPLKFEAIPGGTVDLTTATPVVGAIPAGTTKGDKGDQGDPGPQGDRGPQGDPGPKGDRGPQGDVSVEQLNAKVPITILAGVGSPEGQNAAPIGSIYTDAAATNGAIRWIKTSGTGNTGWRVEYGDTGWRDISNAKELDTVEGDFLVRRVGSQVYFSINNFYVTESTSYAKYLVRLPSGFRKVSNERHMALLVNGTATGHPSLIYYTDATRITWLRRGFDSMNWPVANESQSGTMSYLTDDTWPTSLPGTPT